MESAGHNLPKSIFIPYYIFLCSVPYTLSLHIGEMTDFCSVIGKEAMTQLLQDYHKCCAITALEVVIVGHLKEHLIFKLANQNLY